MKKIKNANELIRKIQKMPIPSQNKIFLIDDIKRVNKAFTLTALRRVFLWVVSIAVLLLIIITGR